jgi:pimeloyl-ACP methyl ester carboxylesterase
MSKRVVRLGWRTLVCVCVTALLGVSSTPVAEAERGVKAPPPPAPLTWAPCTDVVGAECATLKVPMDYTKPAGKTIDIALSRIPATDPSRRIGALLVNPGGPGFPGRSFAVEVQSGLVAGGPSDQEVAARFDVIGFDPRGVEASTAVDCGNLDGLDQADYTPDTPDERTALAETMRAFARACKAGTGDLLRFVGTENAARDVDQIRRALDEPKLTYLGVSYGTKLGAAYANLFPRRVRALVLDAAYNWTSPGVDSVREQAASLTAAFDAFAADCGARPECAARFPDGLGAAFDRAVKQADSTPLVNSATPGSTVTEGQLVTTLGFALFGLPGTAGFIEDAIAEAERGEGSLGARGFDIYADTQNGVRSNSSEAIAAVFCLDDPWPRGPKGLRQIDLGTVRRSPRLGQTFLREFLPCAYWPVKPTPVSAPVAAGAPPIVVVGTTGDPASPYKGAQAMAKQLDSGVLLTHEGVGHGAYFYSRCINDAANAYLVNLTVPSKGTTCQSD